MQVPDHIRSAADRPMFNHRSAQMEDFLARLEAGCRELFGTAGDVLFFASSGTGAMESAIVNMTSPKDEIIVMTGGTFAHRWSEIAQVFGLQVHAVDVDWRLGPALADVEAALDRFPNAETIFITWSESSTGVLTELEEIGKLVRSRNKFLVADAVSGLAVSPLQMDDWNIDVVISGSQKGLMLPPGLGIAAIGSRAWDKVRRSSSPRFYWDWTKYRRTAPFTPANTLLFQLDAALEYIKGQGLDRFFGRRATVADKIRGLVRSSEMEIYALKPGNGITAILPPERFDIRGLMRRLESDFGIQIAGGMGPLLNKTFRIGHVGFVSDDELDYFMHSFKHCLTK